MREPRATHAFVLAVAPTILSAVRQVIGAHAIVADFYAVLTRAGARPAAPADQVLVTPPAP